MSNEAKGWKMFIAGVLLAFFICYLYCFQSWATFSGVFMIFFWPTIYLIVSGLNYIFGGYDPESDFSDWCWDWHYGPNKYKP